MADKLIDARVLARRQKDIDNFITKYHDIIDQRVAAFGKEIAPIWHRTGQRIELQVKQLILEITAGKDVLPDWKLTALQNKVKRLNTLYAEIRNMIGETAGPLNEKLGNKLTYWYTKSYYMNAFGLEQAAQVTIQAPIINYEQVMGVLNNPWLPDGKTYSDRIRANTTYLAAKMQQSIGRAITEGWAWNRTALHIRSTAQEGYFNAVRLARTELTRAASQAATHLYMQNADILDGKRWNATLDSRTAPKDAKNDGKIYALDYDTPENPGVAGERIPNHPNCRCSYSPVLSALGVSEKERIAKTGDSTEKWGQNTYTKARTYQEYAKERGLPVLDERLVNDNSARYLRQDEYALKPPRVPNFLPHFEKAVIPEAKLVAYALNPEHIKGKDKAVVFNNVLGYNLSNWQELQSKIIAEVGKYKATKKGKDKHGQRYEVVIPITGPTGRTAPVLTAWIIRFDEDYPQLTSTKVTKEKVK